MEENENNNVMTFKLLPLDLISIIAKYLTENDFLQCRLVETTLKTSIETILGLRTIQKETSCSIPLWYSSNSTENDADYNFQRWLLQRIEKNRWSPKSGATIPFNVKVFARIRGTGEKEVKHFVHDDKTIALIQQEEEAPPFECTKVFPPGISQEEVFRNVMGRFLLGCTIGLSSTIFFYGQTGSGKTFTSLGSEMNLNGLVPLTVREILQWRNVTLRLRVVEIYCEEVKTLICSRVSDFESFIHLLKRVMEIRTTKPTNYNSRSSRSHAIFSLNVSLSNNPQVLSSTLNLVDLAGAERQPQFGGRGEEATRTNERMQEYDQQLVKEAIRINLSLTTLGRVILCLSEGKKHVPYRDSKLTLLLRSSLGGVGSQISPSADIFSSGTSSGRTAFVLTLSDDVTDWRESLATLRFGERAQKVRLQAPTRDAPTESFTLLALQRRLGKVQDELEKLKTIWMSCGDGHDPLCRCDHCLERKNGIEKEPLHIPRYNALLGMVPELCDRITELQLAGVVHLA